MQRNRAALRGLFPLVAVLAACSDGAAPAEPDRAPAQAAADRGLPPQARTVDERYALIARDVPGFGGMYADETGTLNVYLVDPGQEGPARAAIASVMGRDAAGRGLRVRRGTFGFAELDGWRRKLPAVMALEGVVLSDIDERQNRLRVGVADAAAGQRVRDLLGRLGIPEDAVVVDEADPIRQSATVRDRMRPTQGGLQIAFSGSLCTLGFNVSRNFTPGFVTNSHCTNTQGGVESTEYFQPVVGGTNYIGVEVIDPPYALAGQVIGGYTCPAGRRCRFSDAAFVQNTEDQAVGYVVRPTSRGRYSGSLTIGSNGPFSFTSQSGVVFSGSQVDKVGRTTGWTYGPVTSSCVDVNVDGTDLTLFCQSLVDAGAGPGDSGSPVFTWDGGYYGLSTLHGILWGSNGAGTVFAFSTIGNVERELGCLHNYSGDSYFSDCS